MKKTIVYFSFGPDGLALAESIKSARRVYGDDVGIAVFDDDSNPISGDILNECRPNHYERTTFDRKGNLNGPDCIIGMLFAFQRAVTATKADIIVKTDCDTMILADWLDDSKPWSIQGFWFATRALISGLCYALPATAPETILRRIAGRNIWQGPCPEDATISTLAAVYLSGAPRILDASYDLPTTPPAIGYSYQGGRPLEIYKRYSVVTFGNRFSMPKHLNSDQRRQYAASHMAKLNRYLDKHPRPE